MKGDFLAGLKRLAGTRKLRPAVEEAVQFGKGNLLMESRHVTLAASEALLSKLKLSKEQFNAARLKEANGLRLLESAEAAAKREPIPAYTLRKIFQNFISDSSKQLKTSDFSSLGKKGLSDLISRAKLQLNEIEGVKDNELFLVDKEFISAAVQVHFSTMRDILGDKKFKSYVKAMGRVSEIMSKRSRGQKG